MSLIDNAIFDAQAMEEEGLSDATASVIVEKEGTGESAMDIINKAK